jgi:hypothetical protein
MHQRTLLSRYWVANELGRVSISHFSIPVLLPCPNKAGIRQGKGYYNNQGKGAGIRHGKGGGIRKGKGGGGGDRPWNSRPPSFPPPPLPSSSPSIFPTPLPSIFNNNQNDEDICRDDFEFGYPVCCFNAPACQNGDDDGINQPFGFECSTCPSDCDYLCAPIPEVFFCSDRNT